mmetsp:Transcript_70225/g.217178  ORF Transcript_70225/g.217178 Transcript_70225/m.217178 type:complete len:241 (+) Transcript_70225:696-1418(+)
MPDTSCANRTKSRQNTAMKATMKPMTFQGYRTLPSSAKRPLGQSPGRPDGPRGSAPMRSRLLELPGSSSAAAPSLAGLCVKESDDLAETPAAKVIRRCWQPFKVVLTEVSVSKAKDITMSAVGGKTCPTTTPRLLPPNMAGMIKAAASKCTRGLVGQDGCTKRKLKIICANVLPMTAMCDNGTASLMSKRASIMRMGTLMPPPPIPGAPARKAMAKMARRLSRSCGSIGKRALCMQMLSS